MQTPINFVIDLIHTYAHGCMHANGLYAFAHTYMRTYVRRNSISHVRYYNYLFHLCPVECTSPTWTVSTSSNQETTGH